MLADTGHLFHIDFGHFLGNFKKWKGINRERAPFVFTPSYAKMIGGEKSPNFKKFLQICTKAYNILRHNADNFINLFLMMLSTGIPELQSVNDLAYLRNALSLGIDDDEASKRFIELVYRSLNTKSTQINFLVHILAHRSKFKG